ncbi:MAG: hypothetical protein KDI90_12400 [Alphaproteobacteria bacterium]|nr:hypothetical protein [Alphaproteobacteria bacterium]
MAHTINTIVFDKRTFRHSPFTTHDRVNLGSGGGSAIFVYDDADVPGRHNNVLTLPETFRGVATGPDAAENNILYIGLSGLRADPMIEFTVNHQKVSVPAAEYISGYLEYAETLPPEELAKLEVDEHALDGIEERWSIDFFREKLKGLVDGPDAFFFQVYRGIDNAMGDMQRMIILHSIGSDNKAAHGSFDLES